MAQTPDGGMHFLALRHMAALFVVFAHSFALSGQLPMELLRRLPQLGGIAVLGVTVFFVISGFLISQSWERQPMLLEFARKRFLRIFPGLLGCIVFVVVLGLFFTELPLTDYANHPDVRAYVVGNVLLQNHLTLADVFHANPSGPGVSGSFWTLPLETTAYISVALLGLSGLLINPRLSVLAWCLVWVGVSWKGQFLNLFGGHVDTGAMPLYYAAFALGALHHHVRRWRGVGIAQLGGRAALVLGAGLAVLLWSTSSWAEHPFRLGLYPVAVSGLVIALGRAGGQYLQAWWPDRQSSPDFSYGLYLYSFPIQQALVAGNPGSSGWWVLAWSLPLSLGVAAVSWYVIERPALNWARRAPLSLF